MNENVQKRNRALAARIIKGLESRNMRGYYAETGAEARELALRLIPEGSTVTAGGCTSATEIGLFDALKAGPYRYIDRNDFPPEEKEKATQEHFFSDWFIAGANAMTENGMLVNIDGNANRVAAIAYGPKKVLFLVGMNKVCRDLDAAIKRARTVAAPINAQRFMLGTPCNTLGTCADCLAEGTICCQMLVTRFSRVKDRIEVILVGEDLGF